MNSDFSSAVWSMTALSVGTDDIIAQNGVTIAAPSASFTPAVRTYTNQTVTYSVVGALTTSIKFYVFFSKSIFKSILI